MGLGAVQTFFGHFNRWRSIFWYVLELRAAINGSPNAKFAKCEEEDDGTRRLSPFNVKS